MSEQVVHIKALVLPVLLAMLCVMVFTTNASARWRWGPSGCEWVDDGGPDECSPDEANDGPGRYKTDGVQCWFDETDYGRNQCDPNLAVGNAPVATEDTVPEFEVELLPAGGDPPDPVVAKIRPFPSCWVYTEPGTFGAINVQINPPLGAFQWSAYMYNSGLNYGHWEATVTVDGIPVDTKKQAYPPHASLPLIKTASGSVVSINVTNTFFTWQVSPTWIPAWGWEYWGRWVGGRATGSLQCAMPVEGL